MKKILTIILDGFGIRDEEDGNAIKEAKMNNFNKLWNEYPHSILGASEEAVGLKKGQMGNSEVGHSTIGAGKVLKQPEVLVDEFLADVDLENEAVKELLAYKSKDIHLMGLCSDGNVHAGVDDFLAMYKFLVNKGFRKIHFHLITDGRDTGVNSAYSYIKLIEDMIKSTNIGDIATICGRYYAMDRDKNWERIQKYYNLVINGEGTRAQDINDALQNSYREEVTDEFIKPILVSNHLIKNGDVLLWMNYRADRSKQILSALSIPDFNEFFVKDMSNLKIFTFFDVDSNVRATHFLEPATSKMPLGIYLSELGLTQARVAESEKIAHVTYFFDNGYEGKINNCDKYHIPSPEVATYDLKPEMSAVGITRKLIDCMDKDYDFILANFANPDMVGHTGDMEAATKACMAVDICLGKLIEKAEDNFYKIILLADHGNADTMYNEDHSKCTTHTLCKVPFIITDKKVKLKKEGTLANVAPTILEYMDIALPKEMQDTPSLIENEE